jgi:putative flavoprotein involved in K+ transport
MSHPESLPQLRDGYEVDEILKLNLKDAGITSVIWATGYRFDFSMVKMPIFDEDGYPDTQRGVTAYPGLYFTGLPFIDKFKSGFLLGVGEHAAYIAEQIVGRGETAMG